MSVSSLSSNQCAPISSELLSQYDAVINDELLHLQASIFTDIAEGRQPNIDELEGVVGLENLQENMKNDDGVSRTVLSDLVAVTREAARQEGSRAFNRSECSADPFTSECESKFPAHALYLRTDDLEQACR